MNRLLSLLLFLLSFSALAQPVDLEQALAAGSVFLGAKGSATAGRTRSLVLVYSSERTTVSQGRTGASPDTYFYVFNNTASPGFVIVSGQQNLAPILGYSKEANFDPQHIPDNVAYWLDGYESEAQYAVEHNVPATDDIRSAWTALEIGKVRGPGTANQTAAVNPLVQTKWDQGTFYNALCPFDVTYNTKTVTGCVATSMAQIMKFWNYPPSGTGFHSYNHSTYGTQSANFGSTNYQWSSMPNSVTNTNSAVATLMYHCGVSIDMDYGPPQDGGSGAYTSNVVIALKTYFKYQSTVQERSRTAYNDTQWKNLMKTELDAGRPIEYSGCGSGGCHSFVCDGYDNNDFFHINWGWGGNSDGYFSVTALNPAALGAGGGTGGFNSQHGIIIGIQPPPGSSTPTYDMRLYSVVTANPTPIQYEQGFSVTANVGNFGTAATNNFVGEYTAVVFNSSDQFVGYVETKSGSLAFGTHYTNPLVFTTTGMQSMTPGTYKIGIYYKATGTSEWLAFANGSYQNFITVQVQGNAANQLILYSAIVMSPAAVSQNQSLSINFDVANDGATTFAGEISIDIHKSDGTWIRELSKKSALSLPPGFHYPGGLTFSVPAGFADAPGTYQLFAWSKRTGGEWEVLSNGAYANPINITISSPALAPDIYESNNTADQAFNLPISFTGTTANKNTVGSNCHTGADYDYYKIALPAGSSYTISPRLHDSYASANGNTYTLDALFSISMDGTQWSGPYDDVPPSSFDLPNGGTVFFHVAPFFSGDKGTYLLDVNLVKVSCSQAAPSAVAGTGITTTSFTANWTAATGATGYQLDVSADNFNTFLPDHNSKIVAGATTTSLIVNGLTPGSAYSYRVRAAGTCLSLNSNIVAVNTSVMQSQTITFSTPADRTLGSAPFTLTATSSSSLPVAFTTSSTTVTLSGSTVTMVKAGRTSVSAQQAGNESFLAATQVTRSFCVIPPKPVITFSSSPAPTLTSSATEGNIWYKNGTQISGATAAALAVTTPGTYKVQITADDCLSEFSTDFPVVVTGSLVSAAEIAMFPNPSDSYIYIAGITASSSAHLTDMTGRSSELSLESHGDHFRADVRDLSRGLYIVTIIDGPSVHRLMFTRK